MNDVVNRASRSLFTDGATAVNVKFFPGYKRGATQEQFADQLMRADAQIRNNLTELTTKLDGELISTAI